MLTPLAALLILGLFALFATGDGVFTFGGPTGEVHDGVALVDGFVGFLYADPAHPHFRELLNLALCFGVLVIFATVVTATAITSTDEANGITRLAVAQGQTQEMLFLSKVVVIVAWTLPLWLLHSAVTFAIVMSRAHRTPTRAELGAWLLLLALCLLALRGRELS